MLRPRVTAACLALVAGASLLGACARPRPEPKTFQRTETVPVTLSIELGGDLAGRAETQTVEAQVVTLDSNDPELERNLIYGLEPVAPVRVGGATVVAGFAVLPYRGPGRYTIDAGSIHDIAAAAQRSEEEAAKLDRSSVKVLWQPDAAVQEVYDYYRREEPCRVTVAKGGTTGELDCPRLTNEARDKRFSLKMRWRLPAPTPTTTTTSSSVPPTTPGGASP